jgi:hypothetical protein
MIEKGWGYFGEETTLYSKVCRTLTNEPFFARIHRGFYQLSEQANLPPLSEAEDPVLELLRRMKEPTLVKDLLPVLQKELDNKSLNRGWLTGRMKVLHNEGKIHVAKQAHNKTAYWEVVK